MSKILVASDLHIHTHKNSLQRLQHCLDVLEWIFKTALERSLEDVVFLGDLFQDRQKIQILPYHKTYQIVQKYAESGLRIHLLVGNHDMWYADRTDVSSVFPFNAIENLTVISHPCTVPIQGHYVDFLPFTNNPLESIKKITKPSKVLFGHIALDGAQLNTLHHIVADVSVEYDGDMVKINTEQFKPWQRVFLGHYHGAQKLAHVEYVGSPLELNFAEAFQEKHIMVLDLEDLATEYVVNTFSPRHLVISQNNLDKHDLHNAFVKIKPNDISSADLADLHDQLMRDNDILSLDFMSPNVGNDEQEVENAKNILVHDQQEMLVRYIRATGTDLPEDKLLSIVKELINANKIC